MFGATADGQPERGAARSDPGDRIERLVTARAAAGSTVLRGPVWLTVLPAGPGRRLAHGWKLHISSRAATFPALVDRVLPVLAAEGCVFKLARSPRVLAELNDGITSPASVGKAFTVYPDQDRVRELGTMLAGLLAGHEGPRVLSDRRVSESAPVYYRYGPFAASPVANARGDLGSWLHGPGGQQFEAMATLAYRQPPWTVDPFTGEGQGEPCQAPQPLAGGRYQVIAGIRESARGNVYRAVDQRDGVTVIVKQARALVFEDGDHVDARLHLRNERRICQVLSGVPGVPRFIDHFRHRDDEFLVTSDCGTCSLTEDVVRNGPYPLGGARGLGQLASQLARIVRDVHERGVIVRDLNPANIVLQGTQASLVDFGLAGHDGLHLSGGTPGYAPARQMHDETPLEDDDLYALGMTLLFAATRLHPVVLRDDHELPMLRALQTIRAGYGPEPPGVIRAVADLLAGGDRATPALLELASGKTRRRPVSALPSAAPVTADLVEEITGCVRAELLRQVDQILTAPDDAQAAYDGCLYTGSAGIGLELLHQAETGAVADRLEDLAALSAGAARRVRLPHGLYTGRTGVDIFLQQALDHGITSAASLRGPLPPPGFAPEGDDLIIGAAGIGLGHLLLYRANGDSRHLDVTRRYASMLMGPAAPESSFGPNPRPEYAVEPSASRAHGLAGVTELLVSFAEQTGEPAAAEAAAVRARVLAGQARDLLRRSREAAASPLAASWCQGLTGIGQTLAHAGEVLHDPVLTSLARHAADACVALLPRLSGLGACCGAAGVGNFLVDLAAADERYLEAAYDVAAHMLRRSAGPPGRPVFTESDPDSFSASWAAGLAGMLTFFRRLSCRGGADILPIRL
ncbi:MAG TPA: class IV lanthionine synthetase LanL [Streptosporangiaceae bacterium]